MSGSSKGWAFRAGIFVAVAVSFLTIWTTIVRDDGNGFGFFMLVMAALVGAFSAGFRPAGMARALLGVAIMQALLGISIATEPSAARIADGSFKTVLLSTFFVALWLASAVCFRIASTGDRMAAVSD